jgi:type IV secretory pathway VirB3-like protein
LKTILHNTKENEVAKIKQTKTIVRRNVTMFPTVYHVMSHKIVSISVDFVIERHIVFVITILQKISTNKGHNMNSRFIARKFRTKNHREPPAMISFLRNKNYERDM